MVCTSRVSRANTICDSTSSFGFLLSCIFHASSRANEFECQGWMLPLFKSPRIAVQTYLIIQFFVFHLVNCIVPCRRWQDVLRVLFVHTHFIYYYIMASTQFKWNYLSSEWKMDGLEKVNRYRFDESITIAMDNIGNDLVLRCELMWFSIFDPLRQYLYNFYFRFRTIFHIKIHSVGSRRFLLFSEWAMVEIRSHRTLQTHAILIFMTQIAWWCVRQTESIQIHSPNDKYEWSINFCTCTLIVQ